jgi:DNA-binding MarR family transcriptional regulator
MNPIEHLNKVFDSRVRLGIMSVLVVNEEVLYNDLKEVLELTDGNLASHIKALEEQQYIKVSKTFLARKPRTSYKITKAGEKAFKAHLDALGKMIGGA